MGRSSGCVPRWRRGVSERWDVLVLLCGDDVGVPTFCGSVGTVMR